MSDHLLLGTLEEDGVQGVIALRRNPLNLNSKKVFEKGLGEKLFSKSFSPIFLI